MQLYSYTMQFANTLPFSQHLVPRYSASPAIPPKFLNLGMAKKILIPKPCTKFPPLGQRLKLGLHSAVDGRISCRHLCSLQEILTQLRTIFDLIINFHGIQENMYRAAKDELQARLNYDNSKTTSEQRVSNWICLFMRLGNVMVRTLDLWSRGRGFNSGQVTIKWLVLGWVTVCGQVNHLGI